ncbi:MAG TPA: RcpC/CpaB family pilus assembly protein [Planctomycetaceae bacterium]|nr:RcpC/CpaB family pilus assembly protein [Planctomycetaceae bacterium]
MRLSQEQFTLSRGGKVIVRITKKPSPVEGGTSQPPPQPVAGNANELPRQIAGHNDKISSLAFSPDGTQLLSGSNSGMLLLHDVATRKQLREFSGHKRSIRSVTFSPDGTRVLSSGWDNTIRMWDIATGLQILVIEDKGDVLHTSAFDPTGKLILSCSHVGAAGAIRLWDAETGNLVREFENVSFQPFEVVFSLTGKQALSGAHDGVMRLWDVETGKVFKTFHGHSDWVRSVAFSKDGQFAVSGSKDNTIRVWDVETGELRRTLTGHTDVVESAVFTPDGHRILSGSLDGTVRLWDVATGEELAGFGSPQRSGNRAAISPDGRTVASGANDKLIRLWQMAELYRIEGDSVLGPAPDKSSRSIEIPKGKRLVTVKIDLSPVHRGQLRAGDKVDVFATHAYLDPLDKEKGPQTKTKRILSEVEIFAFDSGRTPNSRDEDSAGTTVSLLVDPEQAVPLLLAAKKGTLNFKLPEEQLPEAANDAALKWFALLDAGEYGKCWDEMASTAKESLTREGLIAQCERSIKPRGRVLSRTLASVSYNHLDRRNPKVLMDMTYETQFENAGKLTETLLLHRDTDGQWRVGAHGISKPNGDRTDSVGKPAE